tara:strand:- start:3597 stop:5081 length:1485 start_codon:yes stop_codon:yes gene_type:complete
MIKYSKSQLNAISKIHDFLDNDDKIFILKGFAGTGKTTLIKYINDELQNRNQQSCIMAPTGRAAKVISDKINDEAYTIHKSIYSLNTLIEYDNSAYTSNNFKYFFGLKNNDDQSNCVYIIDESSMISNNFSESLFFRFGSGYLLNDLIKYSEIENSRLNRKIIFIGDSAQLPPISMEYSPALDIHYLENIYKLRVSQTELKNVIRQKKNSGILKHATSLRNKLKNKDYSQFVIDSSSKDITNIEYHNIINKYISLNKHNNQESIIIAHSNKTVNEYNKAVRNKLFPKKDNISINDKILIARNNYKYGLLNGEFGKVKDVLSDSIHKKIKLKNDGGISIDLYFKDLLIEVLNESGKKIDVRCTIIENLLDSDKPYLNKNEQQALFVLYVMESKRKGIHPKSPEFREGIKTDSYFNALCIKYGYAVTCHKAQGGEWDNAIVDFNASLNKYSNKYYRWAYTALTRCSKKLYAFNDPYKNIYDQLHSLMISDTTEQQR